MRVITGEAKGRRLFSPDGAETRPTSDFVKQAVFSMIRDDIEGRRALDLFAGTGQMGIEALSRGAVCAHFVDNARAAVCVIKKNLEHCRLEANARVFQCGAMEFLSRAKEKYDLIFIDPPYRSPLLDNTLDEIIRIDLLRIGGIIVCESPAPCTAARPAGAYVQCGARAYGRKAIILYTRQRQ